MIGNLLRYGYHEKVNNISKWFTGVGLITGERKVKQTKLNKVLYQTLNKTFNNTIAKPQEYDTLYTVMMLDGREREFGPVSVLELL
jgi:hypothetical protein